jgi:alkanesulfonate monooxygenase SsuD/methylene tetrahydromethanopterin reductase-like flavin-dependent oxidoreductase (luciferase family)
MSWHFRAPAFTGCATADVYRNSLDEIEAADLLGVESVWVTEHHFADDDYLPSPMTALAAVAARTRRARFGPYVALGPFHDPLRLAEDAAVLDNFSGGRLELALGSGYRREEFDQFRVERHTRGPRTGELIELLRHAWSPGPISFAGRFFQYTNVDVTPKPVQRRVPIYLGGVGRPVLARIPHLPVTGLAGRPRPEDLEFFESKLAAHGKTLGDYDYLGFEYVWADRDAARARRVARPFAEWVIGRYSAWLGRAGETNLRGDLYEDELDKHCIMGSPGECVDRLGTAIEKAGRVRGRRLLLIPPLLGADHAESMRTIETLLTDVVPQLRENFPD